MGHKNSNGEITWAGELPGFSELGFIFTTTVDLDPVLYGTGIINTASSNSENAGSDTDDAVFSVVQAPNLSIEKQVILPNDPAQPGEVVTYTITVHNTGLGEAVDVHVVDILPEGLVGQGLDVLVTIASYEFSHLRNYRHHRNRHHTWFRNFQHCYFLPPQWRRGSQRGLYDPGFIPDLLTAHLPKLNRDS